MDIFAHTYVDIMARRGLDVAIHISHNQPTDDLLSNIGYWLYALGSTCAIR